MSIESSKSGKFCRSCFWLVKRVVCQFAILFSVLSTFTNMFVSFSADQIPGGLLEGYIRDSRVRYVNHLFTVNGQPVQNGERINDWHIHHGTMVHNFAQNTFGGFAGRNWVFASMSVVREGEDKGTFCLGEINMFPYLFGSGTRQIPPVPGDDSQSEKAKIAATIMEGFNFIFADDERPGGKPSERVGHFVAEIEPIILDNINLFIDLRPKSEGDETPSRSEEKIRSAFTAWRGGAGDKNLARNWFTDSEQVVLSYVRRHQLDITHKLSSTDKRHLFFILNIATLYDMCGPHSSPKCNTC